MSLGVAYPVAPPGYECATYELVEEYRKTGAFFDPKLSDPARVAAGLDEYVQREREFYQKTGRLK
jgi:hypothetical protein